MDSRQVIQAVQNGSLTVIEDNPYYKIYDCVVKEYPAWKLFVQTSGEPISLGSAMLPLLDTQQLRQFAEAHGLVRRDNTPLEIYCYHWVERAQGPMVFDVGFVVNDDCQVMANEHGFVCKDLPPLKVASIIYQGPFPHEPMSGWGNIEWERRAQEKGLVYTERLYRELYHAYDFEHSQHITEIQMAIA